MARAPSKAVDVGELPDCIMAGYLLGSWHLMFNAFDEPSSDKLSRSGHTRIVPPLKKLNFFDSGVTLDVCVCRMRSKNF